MYGAKRLIVPGRFGLPFSRLCDAYDVKDQKERHEECRDQAERKCGHEGDRNAMRVEERRGDAECYGCDEVEDAK